MVGQEQVAEASGLQEHTGLPPRPGRLQDLLGWGGLAAVALGAAALGLPGPPLPLLLVTAGPLLLSLREGRPAATGRAVPLLGMVLLGLLVVAAGTPHTYAWTFLYLWVIVLARWSSSSWYLLAAAVTPPLVGIALVLLGEGHGVSVTLVHGLFLAAVFFTPSLLPQPVRRLQLELLGLQAAGDRARLEQARIDLARQVHDHLGAALAGATLHCDGARLAWPTDTAQAVRSLQAVERLLARGLSALPALAATAGPPCRWGELGEIFTRQAAELLEPAGIGLQAAWEGDPACLLGPDASRALHGAVTEALANLLQHAGARRVSLQGVLARPSAGSACLRVTIEDDGVGLAGQGPGQGRCGTASRMAEQGGSVTWSDCPGGGTRLELVLCWQPPPAAGLA